MSSSTSSASPQDFDSPSPQATAEERVFFRGTTSWIFLVAPAVRAGLWIVLGLVVLWVEGFIRGRIASWAGGKKPDWLASADDSVAAHAGGVTFSDVLGYVGMTIFLVLLLIGIVGFGRRLWEWFSTRYTLSSERVEIERGIFAKHIENVELWRVRDVNFVRKWWHALLRVAWIRVVWVENKTEYVREIGPIHGARSVYEQLKQARLRAGRSAGAQAVGVT